MKSLLGRRVPRKRVLFGGLTAVLVAIVLSAGFHEYLYAIAWREFKGYQAEFVGLKVRLPLFWFKTDAQLFGQACIGRAYPSYLIDDPVITAMPISPREVKGTDEEVLQRRQGYLSVLNKKTDGVKSATTLDIHSKAFTLYCTRDWIGRSTTNLSCNAAKLPFILYYTGPNAIEPEAEAIFSSFE